MKFYILAVLLVVASTEPLLKSILKSPKLTLQLYNEFKDAQHLRYGSAEDRARFRLFRVNAELVADANSDASSSAEFELNFFSTMTSLEKRQYLGLNITGHAPVIMAQTAEHLSKAPPKEKLWTNVGAVTPVKNQGKCGSCWTFGAVGGLESRYAVKSGVLRNFAEQEYLDCVYDAGRDGCQGGWPADGYDYSKAHGGRLAATSDYPYDAYDSDCQAGSKANALVAYKITGSKYVAGTEAANIRALASGSLAVAFEVTDYFQQYSKGIIKDASCFGSPNHAVTAVGYTERFVLVKNSWGSSWGDKGFVKFTRNYGNCGLFEYSSYPVLKSTGKGDSTPADPSTDYRPTKDDPVNPTDDTDCRDASPYCKKDLCQYEDMANIYCKKTCGKCDKPDDCPTGTIRCPDGICRHEHMC